MNFREIETDENVLVMPGAQVCGDVTVGRGTAFWFNCVCRGELDPIVIGERCNIQDLAMLHSTDRPCILGDDVTVGHGAIVHGATIGNRVLVGMGAIVLDGATIGDDCIIGAGAVVTGKMNAPAGSMILGAPAVVKRALTEEEKKATMDNCRLYEKKAQEYRAYQERSGKFNFD